MPLIRQATENNDPDTKSGQYLLQGLHNLILRLQDFRVCQMCLKKDINKELDMHFSKDFESFVHFVNPCAHSLNLS